MKYLYLLIIGILLSGCNFTNLKEGKAAQVCVDNNTTVYELVSLTSGWRVDCNNGKQIYFTEHEFQLIHGPIVEKYTIKDNK